MNFSEYKRFLDRVDCVGGGCWLWRGSVTKGYGKIKIGGKWERAHRVSYELFRGRIPEGMQVDHLCHNQDLGCLDWRQCKHRRCVRPTHLGLATNRENGERSRVGGKRRGVGGRQAIPEMCGHGHLWRENLILRADGSRLCRACRARTNRLQRINHGY